MNSTKCDKNIKARKVDRPKSIVDDMSFLQINLHKEISAMAELELRIENADVVLMQEPRIIDDNIQLKANKFELFRWPDGKVRSAIIVKKDLRAHLREDLTNTDTTTAVIELKDMIIYVVSVYWDNKQELPKIWKDIVKAAKEDKAALIMGGDFNAWSTLWKSKMNNRRGDSLEDFIFKNDLYVENVGDDKTFKNARGEDTIIDLTLTNLKGNKILSSWHVDQRESCSDHNYVKFKLKQKIDREKVKFRNMKKMDGTNLPKK